MTRFSCPRIKTKVSLNKRKENEKVMNNKDGNNRKIHLYAPDGSGGDEVDELREIIEKFVKEISDGVGAKYYDAELENYIIEEIIAQFWVRRTETKLKLQEENLSV